MAKKTARALMIRGRMVNVPAEIEEIDLLGNGNPRPMVVRPDKPEKKLSKFEELEAAALRGEITYRDPVPGEDDDPPECNRCFVPRGTGFCPHGDD